MLHKPVAFMGAAGEAAGVSEFPQIELADSKSGSQTDSTSWTLNYPDNLSSGDGILAVVMADNLPTITWPGAVPQLTTGGGSSCPSSACRFRIGWRVSDGTESGNTFNVTLSSAQGGRWYVFRITGCHTTTEPEGGGAVGNTGTSVNPGSVTPSWGAEKNLYMAFAILGSENNSISGFPSGYSNTTQDAGPSGTCRAAWCSKEAESSPEDPGAFTYSIFEQSAACVVAIRPAA